MAEVLSAQLQLDISAFTGALQQAQQRMAAFAQGVNQQMAALTQGVNTNTTATQQNATASNTLLNAMQNLQSTARQQLSTLQGMTTQLTQAATSTQQVTAATTQAASAANQASSAFGNFGERLAIFLQYRIISAVFQEITSSIKTFVTESISGFADFERGLLKIATLAPGMAKTTESFKELGKQITALAISTGIDAKNIQDAMYDVQSTLGSGKTKEAFEILKVGADLAVAGFTDVKTATTVLSSAIHSFGLEAADATRVANALLVASAQNRVDFEKFAKTLPLILPNLTIFKVSLQSAGAVLATLTGQGIEAGKAVTGLNELLLAIGAPTARAKVWLDEFARQTGQARIELKRLTDGSVDFLASIQQFQNADPEALRRFFGSNREALRAMAIMLQHLDDLKQRLGEANASTNKLAEDSALAHSGIQQQWKESQEAVNAFFRAVGAIIGQSPAVIGVVRSVKEVFLGLMATLEANKKELATLMEALAKFGQVGIAVMEGISKAAIYLAGAVGAAITKIMAGVQQVINAYNWVKQNIPFVGTGGGPVFTFEGGEGMAASMQSGGTTASEAAATGGPIIPRQAVPSGLGVADIQAGIAAQKAALAEKSRLAREALAEEARLAKEREKITLDMMEAITGIEEGGLAKKKFLLAEEIAAAQKAGVDKTLIAQYERDKLLQFALEITDAQTAEMRKRVNAQVASVKEENAAIERERKALATIRTMGEADNPIERKRLADLERINQAMLELDQARIVTREQLEKDSAAAILAVNEKATHDHFEEEARALKKAQKPWEDLAQDIQHTLSSAFESILSGTFNLWDMIKRGFIKLLADLAAAALTQRIIIPLLMGAVGAAGGAAGGGFAGFGGVAAAGAGGAYGAGGGGGDMLGMGLGFAQNGASIYQGMTGQTLLGNTGLLSGVMGTSLGSIFGFGGTTTASSFFGGGAGAAGAYGVGVDAGTIGAATPVAGSSGSVGTLAGTTVGTALGAVAVGIAAGQIFAKLNAMMGLHGTANTVLSGAGGGAIAGTMILPGIGTAVGAAVGAIGGLIAGILTKTHKPEPLFDPRAVEAGQVGYTESGGLELTREFNISSVKIRDLQYKAFADWEKTFGAIEGGINDMAAQVVAGFQNVSPKFQQALVEPLNAAFADIAGQIAGLKIEGKDAADFTKNLEQMMSETIPGFFNDATKGIVAKLNAAVKKVEPVFEGFEDIIETLTQDLEALHAQQTDMHAVLQGGIAQLQASTLDANGQLTAVQDAFTALIERFTAGNEAEQIALGPIIAKAANDLFAATLAHIRGIQQQNLAAMEQLNQTYTAISIATYSPAQNEAYQRQHYDLVRNQLLQAGEAEQAAFAQQLAQLGAQLFSTVINYVRGVQQANLVAMAQLDQTYTAIGTATYTPAQNEAYQRQQYDLIRNRLLQAGEAEQAGLAQQLAQAGQQLFSTVMSTIRSIQQANLGAMGQLDQAHTAIGMAGTTPAQQEAYQRQQYDLLRNRLFQAGEAEQAALAGQLAEAGKQVFQTVMTYVQNLQQANLGAMGQLDQAHTAIGMAGATPAQQEAYQRQQYDSLRNRLLQAGEAEQAALAGQLAEAGKQVFSTVMTYVRGLQQANLSAMEQLNQAHTALGTALYTPAQQEAWQRQQYDLLRNRLLQAGEAEQAALAGQLAEAGKQVFQTVMSSVRAQQQANLAAMQTAKLTPQLEAGGSFESFNESYRTLQAELDTPARLYMRKREEYDALKAQFGSADAPTKVAMAPQLAQAGAELLRLGKSQEVLGQDVQLVKELQTSLMADMTAAWTALGESQQAWNAAIVAANEAEQARVDAQNAALLAANAQLEQTLVELQGQLQADMTTAHGLLAATNATLEQRLGGLQAELQQDMTIAHNLLAATNATLEGRLGGLQAQLQADMTIAHGLLAATNATLEGRLGGLQAQLQQDMTIAHGLLAATNATLEQRLAGLQAQLLQDLTIAHGLLAATNTTLELRLVGLQQSLVASLVAVDATIQGNFDRLQAAVQGQIDIATAQTVLLAASLSNLGGVDGVVAGSLEVLRQMQDRIGGASRSSDAVLQSQVVLLGGLSAIGNEQLQVLKDMNAKLGGGVRGFAEGSTYIPQNMFAFLHQGERVIPANGGGTGTINQTITIRAEGDSVANQAYSAQLRDAIIGDIERQARLGRTNIMVKR